MIPKCGFESHGEMELRFEIDQQGMKSEYFRCFVCGFTIGPLSCIECGEEYPHDMIHDDEKCVYCKKEEVLTCT